MRRKFMFATAVTVCLALALVPAFSAERGVDRTGDRGKKAMKSQSGGELGSLAGTLQDGRIADRARTPIITASGKAAGLLAMAAGQDGKEAVSTLHSILTINLPSSPENDKILAGANTRLAELHAGAAAKQVYYLSAALQFTSDPAGRTRIEQQIEGLGGDIFALGFRPQTAVSQRDPGPDDTCTGATPAAASENMDLTVGDHNWRTVDVPGPDGEFLRIETLCPTPPCSFDFTYDTDLTLWSDCPPTDQIAFNEDKDLGAGDYMSRIDTGCLFPGTYYIEVGGFGDFTAVTDFFLEVEHVGTCAVPSADSYEDDDGRNDGASIGHPTSVPPHANGWGRAKKENQARSIFPGLDVDHAEFELTRNELVSAGTKGQWATFFNGMTASDGLDDPDTVMNLYYQNEYDYGGRCNEPNIGAGFPTSCLTDQDCIDLCGGSFPCDPGTNGAPNTGTVTVPGLGACAPLFTITSAFDGDFVNGHINDFASNDDRNCRNLDGCNPFDGFGSQTDICMPRTQPGSDSASVNGPWIMEVFGFNPSDTFSYEMRVKNEVQCTFEVEPNNDFASQRNDIELGDTIHGIFDFSATYPFQDDDYYAFDVDAPVDGLIETDGYDDAWVDTHLQLIAGPDDGGTFFLLASSEDVGAGFLSAIAFTSLPPASDLLGNTVADADYIINVTSNYANPNFPYTLRTEITGPTLAEAEPNDGPSNANPVNIGDVVDGGIDTPCDFDSYSVTVPQATFITFSTSGTGDTAMELSDAAGNNVLGCDDDSGSGTASSISGCVAAGTYTLTVRPFSGYANFRYEIDFDGTAGCLPTDPPDISGDSANTCSAFDTCP